MANSLELMRLLSRTSPNKIVLVIIDGLGGLPDMRTGKTELETASTPNLDQLAARGISGLIDPVAPGITPGSSAGHLALFGYDPLTYNIGRGVLEAVGIDFNLQPGDIAARGNFCTVDKSGQVIDRRAGRISTQKSTELCRLLDGMMIRKTRVLVSPVREHRFVVVFRGDDLTPEVSESDPQETGVTPKKITPLDPSARRMADIANQFLSRAQLALAEHYPANMVILRGFSRHPQIPTIAEVYKLKAAAIAIYPMYRGLARLVGMDILEAGTSIIDEFASLEQNYAKYDFFFIHIKGTDSAGEDGDFDRKVKVLEEADKALSRLMKLDPEVVVVTGDHSTPAILKGHSWHPVPVLLSSKWCRHDQTRKFSESACLTGGLGRLPATQVMPLAMANAMKLNKFGA